MTNRLNRRGFLQRSLLFAAAPLAFRPSGLLAADAAQTPSSASAARLPEAKVAITRCQSYGPEVRTAMARAFDLIGGIGTLVRGKTATVKINLTGSDFSRFLNRPAGETFMTHYSTALALTSLLFDAGAKRVRLVESTTRRSDLGPSLAMADWDLKALQALGDVEFENTRNLGHAKSYSTLKVPGQGYLFSSFDCNHSYADTDVLISLAKLKTHVVAGVTLTMKNLFGITPNALYGTGAGDESATGGRDPLHSSVGFERLKLPGIKPGVTLRDAGKRVPRIVADLCAARPIQLAIIDGITSMSGGEGPWCTMVNDCKVTAPGLLVVGLNAVSTDTVGVALMGYDPRASNRKPFHFCENTLLLAEKAGLGTADLSKIEVLGIPIEKARHPYG